MYQTKDPRQNSICSYYIIEIFTSIYFLKHHLEQLYIYFILHKSKQLKISFKRVMKSKQDLKKYGQSDPSTLAIIAAEKANICLQKKCEHFPAHGCGNPVLQSAKLSST